MKTPIIEIRDTDTGNLFALLLNVNDNYVCHGNTPRSQTFASWFNSQNFPQDGIDDALPVHLVAVKPKNIRQRRNIYESFIPSGILSSLHDQTTYEKKSDIEPEVFELFEENEDDGDDIHSWPATDALIASIDVQYKQLLIDYKVKAFVLDKQISSLVLHAKGVRAIWNPEPSMPGGGFWRCPDDTPAAGQFTNRFGRGCTFGATRRIGRGLIAAAANDMPKLQTIGERLEATGEARQTAKLEKYGRRAARRMASSATTRRGMAAEALANRLDRAAEKARGYAKESPSDRRKKRRLDKLNEQTSEVLEAMKQNASEPDAAKREKTKRRLDRRAKKLIDEMQDGSDGKKKSKRKKVGKEPKTTPAVEKAENRRKPKRKKIKLQEVVDALPDGEDATTKTPKEKKKRTVRGRKPRSTESLRERAGRRLSRQAAEILGEEDKTPAPAPKPAPEPEAKEPGVKKRRFILRKPKKASTRDRRRRVISSDTRTGKFYAQKKQTAKQIGQLLPDWDSLSDDQKDAVRSATIEALDELEAGWRKRLGKKKKAQLTEDEIIDFLDELEKVDPQRRGILNTYLHNFMVMSGIEESNDYSTFNDIKPSLRKKILEKAGITEDDSAAAPAPRPKPQKTPAAPTPPAPPTTTADEEDDLDLSFNILDPDDKNASSPKADGKNQNFITVENAAGKSSGEVDSRSLRDTSPEYREWDDLLLYATGYLQDNPKLEDGSPREIQVDNIDLPNSIKDAINGSDIKGSKDFDPKVTNSRVFDFPELGIKLVTRFQADVDDNNYTRWVQLTHVYDADGKYLGTEFSRNGFVGDKKAMRVYIPDRSTNDSGALSQDIKDKIDAVKQQRIDEINKRNAQAPDAGDNQDNTPDADAVTPPDQDQGTGTPSPYDEPIPREVPSDVISPDRTPRQNVMKWMGEDINDIAVKGDDEEYGDLVKDQAGLFNDATEIRTIYDVDDPVDEEELKDILGEEDAGDIDDVIRTFEEIVEAFGGKKPKVIGMRVAKDENGNITLVGAQVLRDADLPKDAPGNLFTVAEATDEKGFRRYTYINPPDDGDDDLVDDVKPFYVVSKKYGPKVFADSDSGDDAQNAATPQATPTTQQPPTPQTGTSTGRPVKTPPTPPAPKPSKPAPDTPRAKPVDDGTIWRGVDVSGLEPTGSLDSPTTLFTDPANPDEYVDISDQIVVERVAEDIPQSKVWPTQVSPNKKAGTTAIKYPKFRRESDSKDVSFVPNVGTPKLPAVESWTEAWEEIRRIANKTSTSVADGFESNWMGTQQAGEQLDELGWTGSFKDELVADDNSIQALKLNIAAWLTQLNRDLDLNYYGYNVGGARTVPALIGLDPYGHQHPWRNSGFNRTEETQFYNMIDVAWNKYVEQNGTTPTDVYALFDEMSKLTPASDPRLTFTDGSGTARSIVTPFKFDDSLKQLLMSRLRTSPKATTLRLPGGSSITFDRINHRTLAYRGWRSSTAGQNLSQSVRTFKVNFNTVIADPTSSDSDFEALFNEYKQLIVLLQSSQEAIIGKFQSGATLKTEEKRLLVAHGEALEDLDKLRSQFPDERLAEIVTRKARSTYKQRVIFSNTRRRVNAAKKPGESKIGGSLPLEKLQPQEDGPREPGDIRGLLLEHKSGRLFTEIKPAEEGIPTLTEAEKLLLISLIDSYNDSIVRPTNIKVSDGAAAQLGTLLESNGFSDVPLVVSMEEAEAMLQDLDEDGKPMWIHLTRYVGRGISKDGKTEDDRVEQWLSGPRYVTGQEGAAAYGRGDYFAHGSGQSSYGNKGISILLPRNEIEIGDFNQLQIASRSIQQIISGLEDAVGRGSNRSAQTLDINDFAAVSDTLQTLRETHKLSLGKSAREYWDSYVISLSEYWVQLEMSRIRGGNLTQQDIDYNEGIDKAQKMLKHIDQTILALIAGMDVMASYTDSDDSPIDNKNKGWAVSSNPGDIYVVLNRTIAAGIQGSHTYDDVNKLRQRTGAK